MTEMPARSGIISGLAWVATTASTADSPLLDQLARRTSSRSEALSGRSAHRHPDRSAITRDAIQDLRALPVPDTDPVHSPPRALTEGGDNLEI